MPTENRTEIAPDFEDRNRLTLVLLEHLGLDPAHVALDSIELQLRDDQRHTITWTGIARITTEQLATLANQADAQADAR